MLEVDSAIAETVIASRNYATVTATDPRLEAYAPNQRRAGLHIPGWDVWGQQNAGQLRPDDPYVNSKGRVLKYETPSGSTSYLDIHPLMLDRIRSSTEAIAITEGVKKADSLSSRDLPAIGLLGVWNWKGKRPGGGTQVVPDFDEINWKRRVLIVYDSDLSTNPDVQRAQSRLGALLERRGATVLLMDWRRVHG